MHSGSVTMSRQLLNLRCGVANVANSSIIGGNSSGLQCFRSTPSNFISMRCYFNDFKNLVSFSPTVFSHWNNGTFKRNFSNSTHPLFSIYNSQKEYSVVRKDGIAVERKHDHPVSQKLISAQTLNEIVQLLEFEADSMDVITVSVAVDVLFDALKAETGLTTKMKHQLLTTVGVQKLNKLLRRFGPRMDPCDIINGIKLLTFLSSPGNNQTLQMFLKLLTKHANTMDLNQIIYMQFLLDRMDEGTKSPLSKALEYALPIVFESQLPLQLDRTDPQNVCECLNYASRHRLKTTDTLIDAALNIKDRIPNKSVLRLMWSLCEINHPRASFKGITDLTAWGFKRVADSIDQFSVQDLQILLSKALKKYSNRAPYFYSQDFLDTYCQRLLKTDVTDVQKLWAMKQVSLFRHLSVDLVDNIGETIASNPSHILNDDYLFIILTRALANLNYKSEKWSTISSILLEHPSLAVQKRNFGWQEVLQALDFLEMDLFPENIIRLLYSADGLSVLEEFQERHHPIKLVLLYNAVKHLHNDKYNGPLPPVSMIEYWKERSRAANADKPYPLRPALQTGLGGESYVINGLYHEGIHIDHGIVMRKGGYPVAVNSTSDSQSDCLSNISKPPESVIVLVKVFPTEMYLNNTRRLRGLPALELKIIENLGHPVVIVDLETWIELPDHEKIPYLMQRIREKMERFQWNQNWGDVIPP